MATLLVLSQGTARAQTQPVPVRESIDARGVDLFRGIFTVDQTVMTIGREQGIAYRKIWRGNGWGNSLLPYLSKSGSALFVMIDGRTDGFTLSGSSYVPTEGNGATLTLNTGVSPNVYTYTARDGTRATFSKYPANASAYTVYGNEGYATVIVRPTGERLDFAYEVTLSCDYFTGDFCTGGYKSVRRVASAKSAYGYIASWSYLDSDPNNLFSWMATDDVTLVNQASEYCSPAAAPCSWPSLNAPNAPMLTYSQSGNQIVGVRRPGSTSDDVSIAWTSSKVSSVTDRAGTTTYAYSDAGNVRTVTVTNALSQATVYTFDIPSQRMTSVRDGANNTTTFTYDASGRLTRTTLPEGNYTNLTYDARGNVTATRVVAKSGSGLSDIVATAVYPGSCTNAVTCNRPTSTTDPKGAVTDYTWDTSHGGPLTVTLPAPVSGQARPQVRYSYTTAQAQIKSSSGTIVGSGANVILPTGTSQCTSGSSCTGTAAEVISTVTYGTTGVGNNLLPTAITERTGDSSLTRTTALSYDPLGNLTSVDGPLAGTADTTTVRYDGLRREVGRITPDPDGSGGFSPLAQRTTWAASLLPTKSEQGNVTGTSDTAWTSFTTNTSVERTWDGNGRVLTETAKGSDGVAVSLKQYSYDTAGRAQCIATRMNPSAYTTLPSSACSLGTQGSFGPDRIARLSYDAAGRTTRQESAVGTAITADDALVTYSANGQQLTISDGENNRTSVAYDGFDRQRTVYLPVPTKGAATSSTTDYEQYTYDANGNVVARRKRDATVFNYSYDALNRLTVKDVPTRGDLPSATTRDIYYGYDLLGRELYARFDSASGEGVANTFDGFGRQLSQRTTFSSLDQTVSYQYDAAGNRTRLTWPDGRYANYNYDALSRPTYTVLDNLTSGLYGYNFNVAGYNTTSSRGQGYSFPYYTSQEYDAAGRMFAIASYTATPALNPSRAFTFNPAGQKTSTANYNDANYAWTGAANVDRNYTTNGLNQYGAAGFTSFTYDANGNLTGDGTRTYLYDPENRMVASTTGGQTAPLRYDPLGRLISTNNLAGTDGRYFIYDGDALLAEYGSTFALQRRYLHGTNAGDDPLIWYEGSGLTDAERRSLFSDDQGSIVSIIDFNGNVINIDRYDEYGIPQSTNVGRFQYTGQAWLPEIGMYYYKARMYSPTLGRFMQTDPIGYGDGLNWYGYVGADPVNGTDPSGLLSIAPRSPHIDGLEPCLPPTCTIINVERRRQGCAFCDRPDLPLRFQFPVPDVSQPGLMREALDCPEEDCILVSAKMKPKPKAKPKSAWDTGKAIFCALGLWWGCQDPSGPTQPNPESPAEERSLPKPTKPRATITPRPSPSPSPPSEGSEYKDPNCYACQYRKP